MGKKAKKVVKKAAKKVVNKKAKKVVKKAAKKVADCMKKQPLSYWVAFAKRMSATYAKIKAGAMKKKTKWAIKKASGLIKWWAGAAKTKAKLWAKSTKYCKWSKETAGRAAAMLKKFK